MIRVLIVEDSQVIAEILWKVLSNDSDIQIVGLARDGIQAIEMVRKFKPDLITMDIHMPRQDGLEATKEIMAYCPTPILILSASVFKFGTEKAFRALAYGALEVMDKHEFEIAAAEPESARALIEKIKMLAKIRVVTHPLAKLEKDRGFKLSKSSLFSGGTGGVTRIAGIVASTGGPPALARIFKDLPKKLPVPIALVQHTSQGFSEGLADWLMRETGTLFKVAENGELMRNGIVYLAPTGRQMQISHDLQVQLSDAAEVDGQKPSGTVLLQSLARHFGAAAMGIILTGMGRDGAAGLKAMHDAGGYTIAQDEKSSVIFGMPRAAVELGAASRIIALNEIGAVARTWMGC